MAYVVEVPVAGDNLTERMNSMRTWLDRQRLEPKRFRFSGADVRPIVCRVNFNTENEATAFAHEFGGRVLGVAAVDLVAGEKRALAEVLPPGPAVRADAAGPAEPGHADTIPNPEPVRPRPQGDDTADDLVSGDQRALRVGELAVDDIPGCVRAELQLVLVRVARHDRVATAARARRRSGLRALGSAGALPAGRLDPQQHSRRADCAAVWGRVAPGESDGWRARFENGLKRNRREGQRKVHKERVRGGGPNAAHSLRRLLRIRPGEGHRAHCAGRRDRRGQLRAGNAAGRRLQYGNL